MAFINFVKGNKAQYNLETYPNAVFFAVDKHELIFQGISYGFSTDYQAVKSVEINPTGLMTISYVNGGSDTIQLTKAMVGLGNVDNTSDADKPVSTATTEAINSLKNTVDNYTVNGKKISENPVLAKTDVGLGNVDNVQQIPMTMKGQANGVAELDENGKVPASQLNGQLAHVFGVDGIALSTALPTEDVQEGDIYWTTDNKKFYNYNGTSWDEPMDPKDDTIYNFRNCDIKGDTERKNILYRWDGESLVEISESLALGETNGTAYEGSKGKANRDALESLPTSLVSEVSRGTVDANKITINVNVANRSGLNYATPSAANFDLTAATTSTAGLMSAQDKSRLDALQSGGIIDIEIPAVTLATNTAGNLGTVTLTLTKADNSKDTVPFTITVPLATQSANGVMSATDKKKLDGIEEGANKYTLPLAASGVRGGIQIGYTTTGKNYAVQLTDEKAFVNVPWTDVNVAQAAAITENGEYNLLLGHSANTNTETAGVNKAAGITYNPSTKVLSTTTFKGALNGNADTATKATQDASGNVITSTYATKQELTSNIDALITRIAALEAALTIQNV